jgi:hypothetical protein
MITLDDNIKLNVLRNMIKLSLKDNSEKEKITKRGSIIDNKRRFSFCDK